MNNEFIKEYYKKEKNQINNLTFRIISNCNKPKIYEQCDKDEINNKNINENLFDLLDENINNSLREVKFSINNLKKRLNILKNENNDMNETINILKNSNNDLNSKLENLYQDNHEFNYNNFRNNREPQKNNLVKKIPNKQNNIHSFKFRKSERVKNNYFSKNNEISHLLKKNQSTIELFKNYKSYFVNDNDKELQYKNSIINDLKNQINYLRNKLSDFKEDKYIMELNFNREKQNNSKVISDLSKIFEKLKKDNEMLNIKVNKNRILTNKLNVEKQILNEKIKYLLKDLNEIKIQQKINISPPYYNLSNNLKKDNIELKLLLNKYTKILNILFEFINELNDFNKIPEINIEKYYDISFLIDNIVQLRNDLIIFIEQNKYNNNDNYKEKEIE